MNIFKRITLAFSTGYIFFFFSERMFLIYAATVGNGIMFPTNFIVFFITMPLGFILFGMAAWKIFHYDKAYG